MADSRLHPLLAVVAFGFLFFSVSTNKLPGYLLPLFPALAICLARALASRPKAPTLLAACAVTLVVLPVAAGILPQALARGLSRSAPPAFQWWWLLPAAAAPIVWILEHAGRRVQSVALLVFGAAAGVAFLKSHMFPVLDRSVSTRHAWTRLAPCADRLCTENIHRQYQYGLRYYSGEVIPTCPARGKNVAIGEPLSNVQCEP
jgi:4-amino-4-deoxy-L-arabinose transferase-like glycosyltransferase